MNYKLSSIVLAATVLSGCAQTDTQAEQHSSVAPLTMNAQRCAAMGNDSAFPEGVDITEASYISSVDDVATKDRLTEEQKANFKPFCKLTGYFEKRVGADDANYAIGFGLSLPDDWNGKFLFQGGGGMNGIIREPLGTLAAGKVPAIFRGFAVATTDGGHHSDVRFNPSFFADQEALLNFYSGAVEKTTVLVGDLLNTIYQQSPEKNYFVGCSTGGREAMTMSQRAPRLFDGIIAGAPARQTNRSEIANLWNAKRLRDASESGNETPFSAPQRKRIVSELLAQCDAIDGIEDGLIFATAQCDFDPKALQCDAQETDSCLTEPQITALTEALAGPKTADGEQVYPGFYFDTGIDQDPATGIPGLLRAQPGPFGSARINEPFDIERELDIATGFPLEPGNAVLTQLSTFAHEGHKLMFFHGVSDPWFSAKDTFEYYQEMAKANGGLEATLDWSKFYFVPGMGHCQGGEHTLDQFDMLSSLVSWVEENEEPEGVVAFGKTMPGVEKPLCPHPTITTYSGKGDPKDAANYSCEIPKDSK